MTRILITDDEEGMRGLMTAALAQRGHEIVEAKSAREALEIHRTQPVDLIVTDLVMRDMDGTELLRRIRALSPDLPVIAVSGNRHSTIYLNMAKLLGANRVFAKPFTLEEFAAGVEQALAGRENPAADGCADKVVSPR